MSRPIDDELEFRKELEEEAKREHLRQQTENALNNHWERAIGGGRG